MYIFYHLTLYLIFLKIIAEFIKGFLKAFVFPIQLINTLIISHI